MAHPYAHRHQDRVGRERAKMLCKGYDEGGKVVPLHPAGTFARNADKSDTHSVLRRALGMPEPDKAMILQIGPKPAGK